MEQSSISMKRHVLAFERGEKTDSEIVSCTRAYQCNAGLLTEYYKIYPQDDT
jgi:hypothetical protein